MWELSTHPVRNLPPLNLIQPTDGKVKPMQKIKTLIKGKNKPADTVQDKGSQIITSIIRMSQKALICVLMMIGIGYIGGIIAILFKAELS